ncbi:hypothetical protein SAMN05444389_101418 [Paracoccus solventivorans]|uniref:Uncharacterized protein n=1 Tax=Paracoccus solventivorans TaxID=53463 RepID=A0A1M7DKW1_9RHOB|nr:hypothetical protein [Paracoccus solventivorans]SHL80105.1 hypothetical protein SAMN05444389_101418 [Paracoccus solventivorans]
MDTTMDEILHRLEQVEQRLESLEIAARQGGVWTAPGGKDFTQADLVLWLEHLMRSLSDAHARLDRANLGGPQDGREALDAWGRVYFRHP